MDAPNEFSVAKLPDGSRRISPTDVSGFLQYGQCWRHLRLRLHERTAGAKSFQDFGAPLQKAPKLLTRAGVEFEKEVYKDVDLAFERIDFERVKAGGGHQKADNDRVADIAAQFSAGTTTILTQPRLEARVGNWTITGVLDLLRFDRDDSNRLTAFIVDIKKSSAATVEHKLQVAFYHEMLTQILANRQVALDRIDLGILFEGPKHPSDQQTPEQIAATVDAKRTFGTNRGSLERVDNASDYVDSIKDLVTGSNSAAERIATAKFDSLPFHLSYVCDACQYNAFCMKWCAIKDDLSLIPQISQNEKVALQRNGI
jgi:predicted RecB family nuclease